MNYWYKALHFRCSPVSWLSLLALKFSINTAILFKARSYLIHYDHFFGRTILIGKQLEILVFVLHYLSRTCSFHFQCISIENFYNDIFVVWGNYLNVFWMSKIRCLSKDNFRTSDAFFLRGSEEYTESIKLKINSTTVTLIIIWRKLPIKFPWEHHRTDVFDSCFNDWPILGQLTELNS